MKPEEKSIFLPEKVYASLRNDIFGLKLLPGDKVTESNLADHFGVSRSPVRQALQRLQNEGLMQGYVRDGWEVVPIDFRRLSDLSELRKLIEVHSLKQLCGLVKNNDSLGTTILEELWNIWRVSKGGESSCEDNLYHFVNNFHQTIVQASGNSEMCLTFSRVADQERMILRLNLDYSKHLPEIYDLHEFILNHIRDGDESSATLAVVSYIDTSFAKVTEITLQRLQLARVADDALAPGYLQKRFVRQQ